MIIGSLRKCVWLKGQCCQEPRAVMWELWLVRFGEEKPMARFQPTETQAESGRLVRLGVGLFYSWKRPSSSSDPVESSDCSDFFLLHFCLCLVLTISTVQHTRSENAVVCSDGQTVGHPYKGLGSLLFPVNGNWGGLLGKSPSFYCSKSSVKHLTLHLSKSLLEWSLFSLQLLRTAEWRYHLSQGDCKGAFLLGHHPPWIHWKQKSRALDVS